MSHDRGCFCGREPYEYDDCPDKNCHKKKIYRPASGKTSKKRVPKVYAVHVQKGKDGNSRYDLSPATDYGTVITLLDDTDNQYRPAASWDKLEKGLENFTEGDFLLPIGSPVFIALAAIAASSHVLVLNILTWSSKEQRYIPIQIDLSHTRNQYPYGDSYD